MRFASFVLRNTLRNRRRTVLTILSISMSLFLVCTLWTVLQALEDPVMPPESARRVVTRHATGLANVMPISYRDRIRHLPGVEQAIASQWFGGVYKDPANFFAQFAVDHDCFFQVYSEVQTETAEQKQAFLSQRTAALVGTDLAKRYGWNIGDRVTLQGSIFPINPEMTIVGMVHGGGSEGNFYFRWDYFNEMFPENIAGSFIVKTANPDDVPAVSDAIDGMFRNSTAPTKTETESAFVLGFMKMFGNVRALVISISTVVLFTVILVAANTMAMSIRERTGEIAILKTLGFAPRQILVMTIAESALIALGGGLLGSLAARLIYGMLDMSRVTMTLIQTLNVRWSTIGMAALLSLVIAFLSTFVPAYGAAQLPIAVAMRRRGE
jgi:putative ABC transport system permease protein